MPVLINGLSILLLIHTTLEYFYRSIEKGLHFKFTVANATYVFIKCFKIVVEKVTTTIQAILMVQFGINKPVAQY